MSVNRAESILLAIQRRAFYLSIKSIEKPFAYVYGGNFNFNGWSYCDLEKEYKVKLEELEAQTQTDEDQA